MSEPASTCVEILPTLDDDQAACTSLGLTSRPSTKRSPARTSAITVAPPLRTRQLVERRSTIFKTRYRAFSRTRARLATLVRRRTPLKTDSIGLLVHRWSQCSAGKS